MLNRNILRTDSQTESVLLLYPFVVDFIFRGVLYRQHFCRHDTPLLFRTRNTP